jgi:hypothetical protein
VRAALTRATQAVASAPEGTRNSTLNREAFCIARFDVIDDATIEAAMIDAALAVGTDRARGAPHDRRSHSREARCPVSDQQTIDLESAAPTTEAAPGAGQPASSTRFYGAEAAANLQKHG